MNFNVNAWRKELASERRESSPKRSNGPMSYIVYIYFNQYYIFFFDNECS